MVIYKTRGSRATASSQATEAKIELISSQE